MKKLPLFSIFSTLCGVAVIALALTVMWGWYSHNETLVQIRPSYPTMKFNTALCFLACGVALIAIDRRLYRLAIVSSAFCALVALFTLLQYPFDVNFGIDTIFVFPDIGTSIFSPGRMAPNTAIAFVLAGGGLYLASLRQLKQWQVAVVALMGSIASVLGAVPCLGYLCGVEAAYLWGNFTHMAMHTSVCFVVLGICIVGQAWQKSRDSALWMPIPICFGLIIVAFSMSEAVRTQEDVKLGAELQARVDHVGLEINEQLIDLYNALDRITKRWDAAGGTPRPLWESDARAYLDGYPYLAGMSKTDTETHIEWIVSRNGDQKALGFKLDSEPQRAAAIAQVLATHTSHTTVPLKLLNGEQGFLFISPLYNGSRYDGLQIAVFRLDDLFNNALGADDLKQFGFSIHGGDAIIFSNGKNTQGVAARWQKSVSIHNGDNQWTLLLVPTREFLDARNSVVPLVVLFVGLIMAFLVSFCAFLVLKGLAKNHILEVREAALEASNRLKNAVLSSTAYMLVATDLQGNVLVFNPQAERSLGYKAEEVIGRRSPAIWHDPEEMAARARELSMMLNRVVKPGLEVFTAIALLRGSEDREWTFVRRDGTRFPGLLSVTPLRRGGDVAGFLGVIADITARKQVEAALRESEETFRMAMEHASIGMALVNPKGRWLKVNRALCQLLGYSEDELLQTDFQDLTYPDDLQSDLEFVRKMLCDEIETYSMEKRYIHKSGHVIWAFLNVSLVRKHDGTPDYFISQIQNITERKEMERIKTEFVSVVSHELRTPLTSIRGSLGLVVSGVAGPLSDKTKELLTIAHKNSERLVHLINDILDVEKIESGKIRLNMQRLHITPLLRDAIEANQAYGDKFKVRYRLASALDQAEVSVDSERIMQIMANLLSNAAKFSPPDGEVLVYARQDGAKIIVEVQDFGAGIPEEFQVRIFGKFAQADSSSTRRYEGTGLGLSITKQLVELMGGEIGFRTKTGSGTTFYFTLPEASSIPLEADRAAQEPARTPARKDLPRILHVEDDIDLNRILSEALRDRADLVSAATIGEAKRQLRSGSFDLVVLDLSLPDGSGIDLLDELEGRAEGAPPVLILSVREVPPDIQNRVAGAIVKLRISETKIAGTILTMLHAKSGQRPLTKS